MLPIIILLKVFFVLSIKAKKQREAEFASSCDDKTQQLFTDDDDGITLYRIFEQ